MLVLHGVRAVWADLDRAAARLERRAGWPEGTLHKAVELVALLHDGVRFSLPEKVLVVLVKAFAPGRYRAWSSSPATGWRLPFAVSAQHPDWGAEMAERAGASPLTVALIRRHAGPPPDPPRDETERLLLALQAFDDRN